MTPTDRTRLDELERLKTKYAPTQADMLVNLIAGAVISVVGFLVARYFDPSFTFIVFSTIVCGVTLHIADRRQRRMTRSLLDLEIVLTRSRLE